MENRKCTRCLLSKPVSEMCKDKNRKDGIKNLCKPCQRNISRKMREKKSLQQSRTIGEYKRKPYANLSDEELLGYLVRFHEEYGRPPTSIDLEAKLGYPHARTYYRRFQDISSESRERTWLDILKLAGLKTIQMDKVWIAWEYLVSVACEKLYRNCLFQPVDLIKGYRPDIVLVDEKTVIDAATSNYNHPHKLRQFIKARNAGYNVEYWCLYRTTEKGINQDKLIYVYVDEIVRKLQEVGEFTLATDMTTLLEQHDTYAQKLIEHRKLYIKQKLIEARILLGRTPKIDDLAAISGMPSYNQIVKIFGTFNEALRFSQIPIGRKTIPVYDEKLAIKELLEAIDELGKIPSYSEFDALRKTYSTKVYKKYFGGMRKCLEAQGIDVPAMLEKMKKDKLNKQIETIKAFYLTHNKMPNAHDYKVNKKLPSHNWVLKHFGSMRELEYRVLGELDGKEGFR